MSDVDPREIFFIRQPDTAVFSKRFRDPITGEQLRIVSEVIVGQDGLRFATMGDEVVLRTTSKGRFQIKATVLEDDRHIKRLTIQKYSTTKPTEHSFCFRGEEIDRLLEFCAGIRTVPLTTEGRVRISANDLKDIVLDKAEARRIFTRNEELFSQIAESEELTRDLIAVGYRRKQLQRFEDLLHDPQFFASEKVRLGTKPEGVWQRFFEENTWIFGYGLFFQFLSKLDHKKLEQVVRGSDVTGPGKRNDALMKTQGRVNSLCFIEIKRHDTPLLADSQIRPGVYAPSSHLTGGVAQVQMTVQDAIENIGQKLTPQDDFGNPTGEMLFNVRPRSVIVAGQLSEFEGDFGGVNDSKVRSFELYRRQTMSPDIITFDELLERARFIVNDGDAPLVPDDDDQIPF